MKLKDILIKSEVIRTLIKGPDPRDEPITLSHKNIFILPTKYGYIWFGLLFIMCLIGLNYRNNLVLLCCFFLTTSSFISLIYCFLQLYHLEVIPGTGEDTFLGQRCCFNIFIRERENRNRIIRLKCMEFKTDVRISPNTTQSIKYLVKAKKRGIFWSPHIILESYYPFGLFRTWTLIKFSRMCFVYPKPIPCSLFNMQITYGDGECEMTNITGIEDFSELDKYIPPEPSSKIFWKKYAKNKILVKKVFSGKAQGTVIFSLSYFKEYPLEKALGFLCFLILEANKNRLMFGLKLREKYIPPNLGEVHKTICLRALSIYEDKD